MAKPKAVGQKSGKGRGKPPTTGTTRREQVNVRLAPGTTARLKRVGAWANRDPSDWARLVLEVALRDAERAMSDEGRRFDELPAKPIAPAVFPAEAASEGLCASGKGWPPPCTCSADVRQAGGHAPGCPAGDELAQGGGVVTSKSVARRLAATGGPAPACTCGAGGDWAPGAHDEPCPLRAYLIAKLVAAAPSAPCPTRHCYLPAGHSGPCKLTQVNPRT